MAFVPEGQADSSQATKCLGSDVERPRPGGTVEVISVPHGNSAQEWPEPFPQLRVEWHEVKGCLGCFLPRRGDRFRAAEALKEIGAFCDPQSIFLSKDAGLPPGRPSKSKPERLVKDQS
jgi:hypothetical protein